MHGYEPEGDEIVRGLWVGTIKYFRDRRALPATATNQEETSTKEQVMPLVQRRRGFPGAMTIEVVALIATPSASTPSHC